jgi:hypothetical protein
MGRKSGKYLIYMLLDPRTNRIRYVGKTTYTLNHRLHCHLSEARRDPTKNYRTKWINSLLKLNIKPLIELIEETNQEEWEMKERYWIKYYKEYAKDKGYKLVNGTDGGDGFDGCNIEKREKKRKEILKDKNNDIRNRYYSSPIVKIKTDELKEINTIEDRDIKFFLLSLLVYCKTGCFSDIKDCVNRKFLREIRKSIPFVRLDKIDSIIFYLLENRYIEINKSGDICVELMTNNNGGEDAFIVDGEEQFKDVAGLYETFINKNTKEKMVERQKYSRKSKQKKSKDKNEIRKIPIRLTTLFCSDCGKEVIKKSNNHSRCKRCEHEKEKKRSKIAVKELRSKNKQEVIIAKETSILLDLQVGNEEPQEGQL